ncbi:hypothetical protein CB1_000931004 [Camelus ferus]|nr:hypothetical protein CB1_000931004 [Camelus ferus]
MVLKRMKRLDHCSVCVAGFRIGCKPNWCEEDPGLHLRGAHCALNSRAASAPALSRPCCALQALLPSL